MLEIKNVGKTYHSKGFEYPVLKNINISVEEGEFVVIMGPSGSGKTTLLNVISGFLKADHGTVILEQQDILSCSNDEMSLIRQNKLGFVFQDFMLLDGLSVIENIYLPQIIAKKNSKLMEEKSRDLLRIFDITDIANKYPSEISGGQKQRVAIARAISNSPSIILADEPTGNLDSKSSTSVIESFVNAQKNMNATIFMVTHDTFAASHANRVVALKDGMIYGELIRGGNPKDFLDELFDFTRKVNGEGYDA